MIISNTVYKCYNPKILDNLKLVYKHYKPKILDNLKPSLQV